MSAAAMGDLFAAADPMTEAKARWADVPDWYGLYCREVLGMSADWRWYSLNADPEEVPYGMLRIVGAVPVGTKRNGRPKWASGEDATRRTHFLVTADFDAWCLAWSAAHGQCHPCRGTGYEWGGWSAAAGNRYATCAKCAGTGKAEGGAS